jgi:hypothetical protein
MTLLADPILSTEAQPRGTSERWTDEDIALLALIALLDTVDVAGLWDSLAPPQYRGLLLATTFENVRRVNGKKPRFWWDVETQQYGNALRGFIIMSAIYAAIEEVKQAAAERHASAMAAVFAGTVDIGEWQRTKADDLKTLALVAAALGRGGVSNLTGDDLKSASDGLLLHYAKLERFARQIEKGVVTDEEEAKRRAAAYPLSVIAGRFDSTRVLSHIAAGFDQERNILDHHAENCQPHKGDGGRPSCPSLTDLGWVDIGTLTPIGERICLWYCKCHLSFQRSAKAMAVRARVA